MSSFVVDSRSLLAVRDALGRLHEQLLAIPGVVSGFSGTLGGAELEEELAEFCGDWQFGVGQIADQVAELMRRLTEAAAAYERIEHRVAHASHAGHSRPATGSGGAAPAPAGGPRHGSGTQSASGSGVTVIGGGGSSGGGSGSGSGVTVIGGGGSGGGGAGGSGSGTTVIDGGAGGAAGRARR